MKLLGAPSKRHDKTHEKLALQVKNFATWGVVAVSPEWGFTTL